MIDDLDKDLKDIDKLLALMKTISKHKVDYSQMYKNLPMKNKSEIELIQQDLSKVFRFLTEFKISNERKNMISQHLINEAHNTAVDLSSMLHNIKKAYLYYLDEKKKNGKR